MEKSLQIWKKRRGKDKLLITSNFSFLSFFFFFFFYSVLRIVSMENLSPLWYGQAKFHCSDLYEVDMVVPHHFARYFVAIHPFPKQALDFTCLPYKSLANTVGKRRNPFPHNDNFWRPWETSLLKTLWEKEKLLVTSNFSFSPQCFLIFQRTLSHFH